MRTRRAARIRSSSSRLRGCIAFLVVFGLFVGLSRTAAAQVTVTKTDGTTYASAGEALTYTIVVSAATADSSVTVADTFSAKLTGCSWTSVAAGEATGNSTATGMELADTLDMPGGSSVTYTVTCTVAAGANGMLVNTVNVTPSQSAAVSAADNDTELGNGFNPVTITKTVDKATAVPGQDSLVYTIVVTHSNEGSETVTVTDTFPTGLTCATSSVTTGTVTGNTSSGNISDTLTMGGTSVVSQK